MTATETKLELVIAAVVGSLWAWATAFAEEGQTEVAEELRRLARQLWSAACEEYP